MYVFFLSNFPSALPSISFDIPSILGNQISFDFREISGLRQLPHQICDTHNRMFKILSGGNVRPGILHRGMSSAVPAALAIPSKINHFGANKLKISKIIEGNRRKSKEIEGNFENFENLTSRVGR